ncbi:uncharacterized protein N7506_002378 [Penicillium brevicompactum]|uniref:uncharacterized protein n=1 Tax=Penicillium brevicompactum TaxID=5074 RepID=UPI002540D038|nr:uncharacterized protein N7506_002378 [Penicillium brevicompactum]KAJ5349125.1 hypothetical protein N7506_002378 [Penicillium brevicompactum]
MACVAGVNRWVTQKSRSMRDPHESSEVPVHIKRLVPMLINLGFVELEELRAVKKLNELEKPVQDEYI